MSAKPLIPPPLVAAIIGALMWWAKPHLALIEIPDTVRIGIAAAIVGFAIFFDLAALISFRRARTTVDPTRPCRASALVVSGIYRVTRNPMYVGLLLLLLAWMVWLSSLWLIAGPLLFILYMNRFQIAAEERALSALFPDEYAAYRRRVRRWL
jgi:protein-S-isoprenylcysteine O-methyltransferase Ste14